MSNTSNAVKVLRTLSLEDQLLISLEQHVPEMNKYLTVTPTGLLIGDNTPPEVWGDILCGMSKIRSHMRIWLMDLLQFGDTHYDDATVVHWSEVAGLSESSLDNLRSLGKKITPDVRREGLTAGHYDAVAGVRDVTMRARLIDWAAETKASVHDLRVERRVQEEIRDEKLRQAKEGEGGSGTTIDAEPEQSAAEIPGQPDQENNDTVAVDLGDDDMSIDSTPDVPTAQEAAETGWVLAVTYYLRDKRELRTQLNFQSVPGFPRGLRAVMAWVPESVIDKLERVSMRPLTDDMPDPNWLVQMDWRMEFHD